MKRILPLIILLAAAYALQTLQSGNEQALPAPVTGTLQTPGQSGNHTTGALVPGSQVQGSGTVVRVLSDDNKGSRHQRFILQLGNGRTLLVAHNIDLAPRVDGIREGDIVEFFGEFESNPQGGVIHWTHHDPQGRHPDGWLRHEGRMYQ